MRLTDRDRDVLAAYLNLDDADPDAALRPSDPQIREAAGGSSIDAYDSCRRLKRAGALACDNREGPSWTAAPNYWLLPRGRELLVGAVR